MPIKITCLGSGSSGNSYLIEHGNNAFIIECGIDIKYIKEKLNFDLSKVRFACALHEHFDHSKYVKQYLSLAIPVYMNIETAKVHNIQDNHFCKIFENLKQFKIGEYTLLMFPLQHDVPCSGMLISHKGIGKLLYISDTFYCRYTFLDLNYILIESNYDTNILEANIEKGLHPSHARRIFQSHLEISQTIETLKANDLSQVRAIILLHLSDGNSNSQQFKDRVQRATGKITHVAEKNMIINC